VRLQVFDRLADGPLPQDTLAERLGLPPEGTERLVAAAVALQLLERRQGGRVALGRLGAPMVGNRAIASMVEHHATLYGDLSDPVALLRRQVRPAMAGYWPYVGYAAGESAAPAALSAERVAEYSALMSASQPLVTREVLAAFRFDRHRCLLDVGGGEGSFLVEVARQAPRLELRLFDLPAVAERAQARFAAAGLGARAQALGGDFFTDELPRGADLVCLVRVLHDHDDATVEALLRAVRRALEPGGRVVIAEPLAAAAGAERMGDAYFGLYLFAMGQGRPRSAATYRSMLRSAGFAGAHEIRTRLPLATGVVVATA
jgi:demethylspheroidene O-methyltransferase